MTTVTMPRGLLERLNAGELVIGDGGYVYALEKRGYVTAGPWTPEAVVEHPEAVRQLHREFLRAGADVMQTFTFYAEDDKLEVSENQAASNSFSVAEINRSACAIAREVADAGGALVAGGVSQTAQYSSGAEKIEVQKVFRQQLEDYQKHNVDFLIAEYFDCIEEIEWAIEVLREGGKPVCASMCIGPEGDMKNVPTSECAIRMARAGADVVGINCGFGPVVSIRTLQIVKESLESAGIKKHLIIQANGYRTHDGTREGFTALPENPFAMEPRTCTRWEFHEFARAAYDLGARYIGGCCGTEPYHIRAIAEELNKERGRLPAASAKHGMWGVRLASHAKPWVRERANKDYWKQLKPRDGRPKEE